MSFFPELKRSTFWAAQPVLLRAAVSPCAAPSAAAPEWSACELEEVVELLDRHYVEDRGGAFRLTYSIELLRWSLAGRPSWAFGTRDVGGRLTGFIAATATALEVRGVTRDAVVVNYLCVRGDQRGGGLAPALIAELTRRVHEAGIRTALFTTSAPIPVRPLAVCHYFCRALDPATLLGAGFLTLPRGVSEEAFASQHALPSVPEEGNVRRAEAGDAEALARCIERASAKFAVRARWSEDDVRRRLLDGGSPAATWVRDGEHGIDAVASWYPLRLAGRERDLRAAYLLCAFGDGTLLDHLLQDAGNSGCHVFFALDALGLRTQLDTRGFTATDATLGYYLYDWPNEPVRPHDIAVISI